jgi:hypothetical protein
MKNRRPQIQAIRRILDSVHGETFYQDGLDQRGMASLIETYTQNKFKEQELFEYEEPKSVRSIDDFTLKIDGATSHTYLIDVKTHDRDRKFSMPNLISTERLYKLYQDTNVTFGIIIIDYESGNHKAKEICDTKFLPIEHISWESLSIQNLGMGQIQITNLNKDIKFFRGTRKEWMAELAIEMTKYHNKLVKKLKKRQNTWLERKEFLVKNQYELGKRFGDC